MGSNVRGSAWPLAKRRDYLIGKASPDIEAEGLSNEHPLTYESHTMNHGSDSPEPVNGY